LDKEKDKMNKHMEMGKDTSMSKTNSRLNVYSMINGEVTINQCRNKT